MLEKKPAALWSSRLRIKIFGSICACFQSFSPGVSSSLQLGGFWKRLEGRIYHNEVQQTHTNTSCGDPRRNVDRTAGEVAAHVERYNNEINIIEEYVDVLHFGLAEYGGVVAHSELTVDQRRSMLTTERSNVDLYGMREGAIDNTDPSPTIATDAEF